MTPAEAATAKNDALHAATGDKWCLFSMKRFQVVAMMDGREKLFSSRAEAQQFARLIKKANGDELTALVFEG